jgi:tRNA G37 N-methylase TrmD
MLLKEQQQKTKSKAYAEAIRYMENAKETLKKAGKEDCYYNDSKYVSTACGTAYKGVLIALDTFLALKDVADIGKGKRKSIEYYTMHVSDLDKKMLKYLNTAYAVLHIAGYYEGVRDARVVKAGFDAAYSIIESIKPDYIPELELPSGKPSLLRRLYSLFF